MVLLSWGVDDGPRFPGNCCCGNRWVLILEVGLFMVLAVAKEEAELDSDEIFLLPPSHMILNCNSCCCVGCGRSCCWACIRSSPVSGPPVGAAAVQALCPADEEATEGWGLARATDVWCPLRMIWLKLPKRDNSDTAATSQASTADPTLSRRWLWLPKLLLLCLEFDSDVDESPLQSVSLDCRFRFSPRPSPSTLTVFRAATYNIMSLICLRKGGWVLGANATTLLNIWQDKTRQDKTKSKTGTDLVPHIMPFARLSIGRVITGNKTTRWVLTPPFLNDLVHNLLPLFFGRCGQIPIPVWQRHTGKYRRAC